MYYSKSSENLALNSTINCTFLGAIDVPEPYSLREQPGKFGSYPAPGVCDSTGVRGVGTLRLALLGKRSRGIDALPVTVVRGACWPDYLVAFVRVQIVPGAWGDHWAAGVLGGLKSRCRPKSWGRQPCSALGAILLQLPTLYKARVF